jgi:hypothetical protein
VVFDHNEAISAGAVWIGGRDNTMAGMKVTVDGCLFFRNTVVYMISDLSFMNLCPSTILVNNTDFLHSSGFCTLPLLFDEKDGKIGVEGQRHSWTVANSHFEGIRALPYYGTGPTFFTVYAPTADGTIRDVLVERLTVVDAQAATMPNAIFVIDAGRRPQHVTIREVRVAGAVGIQGDGANFPRYQSGAIMLTGPASMELSRLTIEDSGSFVEQSRGEGVLVFTDSWQETTEHLIDQVTRLVDSTFVRNQASVGGAIAVLATTTSLAVQRCFFQVGIGVSP